MLLGNHSKLSSIAILARAISLIFVAADVEVISVVKNGILAQDAVVVHLVVERLVENFIVYLVCTFDLACDIILRADVFFALNVVDALEIFYLEINGLSS